MKSKSYFWLMVRVGLMIVALVQSKYFMGSLPGDFSKAVWPFFFEMVGIVTVIVFVVACINMPHGGTGEKWIRPSWFISPFRMGRSLLIFDFSSYYFLSLGLGSLFLGYSRNPKNWAWELPLSIGLGAFFGVRAVLFLFRGKFGCPDSPKQ